MKITDITISEPYYVDLPMQGDARQRWGGPRPYAFLEVTTDEEIAGLSPVSYASEIRTFILDVYKPLILGEDPFEVERIWEKVYWTHYGNSIPDCTESGQLRHSLILIRERPEMKSSILLSSPGEEQDRPAR